MASLLTRLVKLVYVMHFRLLVELPCCRKGAEEVGEGKLVPRKAGAATALTRCRRSEKRYPPFDTVRGVAVRIKQKQRLVELVTILR